MPEKPSITQSKKDPNELPRPEALKTIELSAQAQQEFNEAWKQLASLKQMVDNRYDSSSIADDREKLRDFKDHNDVILAFCAERANQRPELSDQDRKIIYIAARLHDLAKADSGPPGTETIFTYTLANHHEMAAAKIDDIMQKPEVLKYIFQSTEVDQSEITRVAEMIKTAIRSHMGPNPGFMKDILNQVNAQLREKDMLEIEHPLPKSDDAVSQVLLTADMTALVHQSGWKKIKSIRENEPFFRGQDNKQLESSIYLSDQAMTSDKVRQKMKELEVSGQKATLSRLEVIYASWRQSAVAAYEMVKNINPEDGRWLMQEIERTNKYLETQEGLDKEARLLALAKVALINQGSKNVIITKVKQ